MAETIINVPGKFKADEYGTPLADASDIYDDVNNKTLTETISGIKEDAIDSYGPYFSVSAAHNALSEAGLNKVGKTVGIIGSNNTITEYWYQGGTGLSNLVEKNQGGGTEQIQSDWNQTDTTKKDFIKNKPVIPTVPTNVSAFNNDAGYLVPTDIANKADKATTLEGYGILNGYTKLDANQFEGEVNNRLDIQEAALALLNGSDVVVVADHTQVASPDTQKIYREYGVSSYTDYMCTDATTNPATWQAIATYSFPGIDNKPTADSEKLAKSGGIAAMYGIYTNNSEYLYAITDNSGKFLCGIKTDGSVDWAVGVPTPIKDYIEQYGPIGSFSNIESNDYIFLIEDKEGKVLLGIMKDGTVNIPCLQSDDIEKIKEETGKIDNIEDRVETLEHAATPDENTIIQATLTLARQEFAPIGQSQVTVEPKRKIKILFIGNSVTQDHVGYLPWLFKQLYADNIDFVIGNFYAPGVGIVDFVNNYIIDNNPSTGRYSVAENTATWTQHDNTVLLNAVQSQAWDYISIQGYPTKPTTPYEDLSLTPQFVDWLRAKALVGFELCYLINQWFTDAGQIQTLNGAETVLLENPVSLLFAPLFCIKEAQKFFPVDGVLSPAGDGVHLKEGLPVMITSMHLMQVICKRLGISGKVLGNKLMMTYQIWQTLNVPGPNGTPDDSLNTDYNYSKVQWCSIQGTKEGEAFYAYCTDELRNALFE